MGRDKTRNTNRFKKTLALKVANHAEEDAKTAAQALARADAWAHSPAGTPYGGVLNTVFAEGKR